MSTYSTSAAEQHLAASCGISASTIRNYTRHPAIAPLLSADATPQAGRKRRLTDADLSVIASIYCYVQNGVSITDAAGRVAAGELSQDAPGTAAAAEPNTDAPQPAQLVPASAYTSLQSAYDALWERIVQLEKENTRLSSELDAANRPLWRKILGR